MTELKTFITYFRNNCNGATLCFAGFYKYKNKIDVIHVIFQISYPQKKVGFQLF